MEEQNISKMSDEEIERALKVFNKSKEQSPMKITKLVKPISSSKAYYLQPTPIDLQIKEKMPPNVIYNGNQIHEWNIDSLNEYQIIQVIKNMMLFSSATIIYHTSDKTIVLKIIAGFVRQLQIWCDNYLNRVQCEGILNVVKKI